jgi:hypothetical protein
VSVNGEFTAHLKSTRPPESCCERIRIRPTGYGQNTTITCQSGSIAYSLCHMIVPEDEKQFQKDLEVAIFTLESRLGPSPFVRPFVCDGPLNRCDVFIVGINPRRDMAFLPFWDGREYCKSNWEREYYGTGNASQTRNRLNFFCEGASPASVLETNIYPVATKTKKELNRTPAYMDDTIFALLLQSLRPRVVITHSETARIRVLELLEVQESAVQEILLDMRKRPPDPTSFTKACPRPWGRTQVVYLKALKQLAYGGYSYEFMRQLGSHAASLAAT